MGSGMSLKSYGIEKAWEKVQRKGFLVSSNPYLRFLYRIDDLLPGHSASSRGGTPWVSRSWGPWSDVSGSFDDLGGSFDVSSRTEANPGTLSAFIGGAREAGTEWWGKAIKLSGTVGFISLQILINKVDDIVNRKIQKYAPQRLKLEESTGLCECVVREW